jgi:hypothetical protein
MASDPPKVLISYSHDSPEHRDRVPVLSKRLRKDGIDCTIDQYVVVPPEGWPRWMEKQIRNSDFVLIENLQFILRIVLRIILRIRGMSGGVLGALHLADYQRLPRCLYDPLRQYNARIDLEDSFYLG